MKIADCPSNESARISNLRSYQILDTPFDSVLDELVKLASDICQTPVALINFVDRDRVWLKARIGVDNSEIDRSLAFCSHTILESHSLTISDLRNDSRFFDNPFVSGPVGLRFYCGVNLISPEGYVLGTICVSDTQPRIFYQSQIEALKLISKQIVNRIVQLKLCQNQIVGSSIRQWVTPTCLSMYLHQLQSIMSKSEKAKNEDARNSLINELRQLGRISAIQSVHLEAAKKLDDADLMQAFARSISFFIEVVRDQ